MATAQNLVVNILGNASQLSRTAKRAQGDVQQLEMRVVSSVRGIISQFAGLAGLAGLSFFAREAFASVDANAKLADSLGTTTERLTGLHHAGNLSGVAINDINAGLTRMSRRLDFASKGGGAAIQTVRNLGLEAERLKKMDPAEAFKEIAEHIRGLPTQAEKGAAAFQLFGNSGAKLLPLIEAGADGIEEMMQEAERLGLTFSRLDAQRIEQANDAMARMQASAKGTGQELAILVAPLLTRIADTAQRGISAFREWGQQALAMGIAVGTVATALWAVRAAQQAVVRAQMLIKALAGPKGWAALAAGVAIYTGSLIALEQITGENIRTTEDQTRAVDTQVDAIHRASQATEQLTANAKSHQEVLNRWRSGAEKLRDTLSEISEASARAQREAGMSVVGGVMSDEAFDAVLRGREARDRAIDQATGIFGEIQSVQDELARLRGDATETEQKLRDMLEAGAPRAAVETLRDLIAQRERLQQIAERERKNEENDRELMRSADSIRQQIQTPEERFRAEARHIKALAAFEMLTREEAIKAIAQARERHLGTPDDPTGRGIGQAEPNTALSVRSREGMEAFTALFRPGEGERDVEEQQLETLGKLLDSNEKIRRQTKPPQPIRLG